MNKEVRSFSIANDDDSRKVGGYAIVFDSLSVDLGGFREIISPTAITEELVKKSDIVFNFNHDNNYMLGRYRNGDGTLSLRIDDVGLYFECELPKSPMGDNILESIRRGDLSQCSFAFALDPNDDSSETWEHKEDGIYRTINKIAGLYDVSCVTFPAYEETSISERAKTLLNDMIKEDIELREEEVKDPEEEKQEEEPKEEEKSENCDEKEEEREDPKEDEVDESESETEDEEDKEEKEDEKDPEEERNIKTQNKESITMEKRFSLVRAIRNIANHKALDQAEQAVANAGAEAMRDANLGFGGDFQLPVAELRDDPVHYTVEADGDHVVVTDYLNILEPLRANNVLVGAGAHFMSGLKGDVKLPIGTDVEVFWENEISEAQNGAGSFSSLVLSPKRIAAVIPLSLQLLAQDTLDVENYVRNLLVTKVNEKLEATILGEAGVNGAKPAGIFYNVTAEEVSNFSDICNLESDLEDNNFNGKKSYIVSPKAKAALRSMIKGTNATGMVWEDGEVDGIPAYDTTHIATNKFAVGLWDNLYIGQWGALDLAIDETSQREKGIIRLIVNAFFDYKVVRDGAIVYGEIKNE